MTRATLLLALSIPAMSSLAASAPADDGHAKSAAQALLSQGTDLYDRGDYAAALDKFTAAYQVFPSPKLWFNVGQANRDLGRPVEALDAFERFLSGAPGAPAEAVTEARRSVAELRAKLGQLRVTCAVAGAEITVDGKRAGAAPLDRPVWTTPGRHQVAVRYAGFASAVEDAEAVAGSVRTVAIDLKPLELRASASASAGGADAAVGTRDRRPAGEAERETPVYRRAWFWVAVGAVVAAGAAGAFLYASRGPQVPGTNLGAQRAF